MKCSLTLIGNVWQKYQKVKPSEEVDFWRTRVKVNQVHGELNPGPLRVSSRSTRTGLTLSNLFHRDFFQILKQECVFEVVRIISPISACWESQSPQAQCQKKCQERQRTLKTDKEILRKAAQDGCFGWNFHSAADNHSIWEGWRVKIRDSSVEAEFQ